MNVPRKMKHAIKKTPVKISRVKQKAGRKRPVLDRSSGKPAGRKSTSLAVKAQRDERTAQSRAKARKTGKAIGKALGKAIGKAERIFNQTIKTAKNRFR